MGVPMTRTFNKILVFANLLLLWEPATKKKTSLVWRNIILSKRHECLTMRIYSKAKSGKMSILKEQEFLLLYLHCPFALHKVISEMTSSIDMSWNVSNRTQKHPPQPGHPYIAQNLPGKFTYLVIIVKKIFVVRSLYIKLKYSFLKICLK